MRCGLGCVVDFTPLFDIGARVTGRGGSKTLNPNYLTIKPFFPKK
jgi:hypothetical protein